MDGFNTFITTRELPEYHFLFVFIFVLFCFLIKKQKVQQLWKIFLKIVDVNIIAQEKFYILFCRVQFYCAFK